MSNFRVGVGSTNPVKVAAARAAVEEVLQFHADPRAQGFTIEGLDVPSGVSIQPMTDHETRLGAQQRAVAVLDLDPSLDLAIGLEGGVMTDSQDESLYTTVWISVVSRSESGEIREGLAGGGRIRVPARLAAGILAGEEMGPLIDDMLHTENSKHKGGLFGVVTTDVVPRQREYQGIAVMAMALWWTGKTDLD